MEDRGGTIVARTMVARTMAARRGTMVARRGTMAARRGTMIDRGGTMVARRGTMVARRGRMVHLVLCLLVLFVGVCTEGGIFNLLFASHRYLGLSMMICNKKCVFLSRVSSCNVSFAVLSS